LNRRFRSGLAFGVAYTFRKHYECDTKSELLFDPFNASLSRGPSTFDHTHVLVLNYIYDIPFLRISQPFGQDSGRLGESPESASFRVVRRFRCWALSTRQVSDGYGAQPWSVTESFNRKPGVLNFDGDQNYGSTRPSSPARRAHSEMPGGRDPRSGFRDFEFRVRKNFAVTERVRLQVRGEAFNVLNHPTEQSNVTPTSSSFGRVQAKTGNRDIQVALRWISEFYM